MATVNKDFKIKSGLIVEGTNGTINGQNILTESQASQDFIVGVIGGETLVKSVSTEFDVTVGGELSLDRTVVDAYYDAAGTAAAAQTAAETFATDADTVLYGTVTSDISTAKAEAGVIAQGYADAAESNAALDATDKADAAEAAAIAAAALDATTKADTAEDNAVATAALDATAKANAAEAAANDYTDGEIVTALITAQGYADVAESNANAYTDNAVSGLAWKQAVNLKSDSNITVAGSVLGLVIDGHAALDISDVGYSLLLTGQTTPAENGIWETFADGGVLYIHRRSDSDTYQELIGSAVYVMEGTQYGSTSWVQGNHYITSFDGQNWTQFSGQGSVTAGSGITVDGLEVSVNRTTVDAWYDAAGSAASAETAANGYTDGEVITALSTALGYANTAEDNAIAHTDGEIVIALTTAQGYATTAQSNAESFATSAINALSTTDIEEGTSLYFTDSRAKTAAADLLTAATLTNITITGTGSGLTITAENGVADSDTDDLTEGVTNLYFTDQRAVDALEAVVPNFTAVELNSVAKQVAATLSAPTAGIQVGYAWPKATYRSAEFLVKVAYATHTEISKVLLTLDTSDNIAITEYGIVGTNGSASTISAAISGTDVQLQVTTTNNNSTVTVVGTVLA